MSDEILAGVDPALDPPVVVPELEVPNQTDENTEDTEKPSKTFTQEELDEIVRKRLGKEQRKFQREFEQRMVEANRPRAAEVRQDQFETPNDYAEALAAQKVDRLLAEREARRQYDEINQTYVEKEEEARDKYDDFEQVAYNSSLPISDTMAEVIRAADNGPDVIYYLGSNPKEAARIFKLPPALQAKEIGKIEARLDNNPPVKKSSSAPSPISPVTARTSGTAAYQTTDPRSISAMSTEDWIAAERQRQIKALEARRLR